MSKNRIASKNRVVIIVTDINQRVLFVMNKPNQVVPSFASVYLTADTGALADAPILFDILETDGSDPGIYDKTSGTFTAPVSAWYDIDAQLQGTLTELYIVKNGDTNFPPMAIDPTGLAITHMRTRLKLALGETVQVYATGSVVALSGTTPNGRSSNAIFTMVKRFDDTKTF